MYSAQFNPRRSVVAMWNRMLLILAVMGLLVVAIQSVGAEDVQTASVRDQGAPSGVAGEALQSPPTAAGPAAIARQSLSNPDDPNQPSGAIDSPGCDCWGVPVSLVAQIFTGFNLWINPSPTTAAELFVDLAVWGDEIKAIWVWDGSSWDLYAVFGVTVIGEDLPIVLGTIFFITR